MLTGLNRAFFLLAAWVFAASAYASYAQMRLEGVALILAFLLTLAYGVIVNVALLVRIFRYRAALIVGSILAVVVVFLYLGLAASPSERAGFFKLASGGSGRFLLVAIGAVILPFIVIAPFAQYVAMRDGRPWPRWIPKWMAVQVALLPAFFVLLGPDYYFWHREYAAGQAEGREARAGEMGALLERAEQRHERIWGTGWTYPWRQRPPAEFVEPSGWILGLALGVNASAPVATIEPL